MTDILYALVAIICAIILEILLNRTMAMGSEGKAEKAFIRLLIVSFMFCLTDAFWGLIGSHTLNWGNAAMMAVSFLFHVMAAVAAFVWLLYVEIYLNASQMKILMSVGLVFLTAQIVLLVVNLRTGIVFTIDAQGNYFSGEYRIMLFMIQYMYYLFAAGRTTLAFIKSEDSFYKKRCAGVIVFSLIPILLGVLQLFYPYAPFYSIGFMVAATIIFIYNISSEREEMLALENRLTKIASKQNLDAINAISNIYTTMSIITLPSDSYRVLRDLPEYAQTLGNITSASERLRVLLEKYVNQKHQEATERFADLSSLARRMSGKSMLSHEYLSNEEVWKRAYFIRVSDDAEGQPEEVLFAVEIIDEEKKRELEMQSALAQALENKNEIYAEILKLQSNGTIATDMDNKIVFINTVAARIYGYPNADCCNCNIDEIIEMTDIEDKDRILQSYIGIKAVGGAINYEGSVSTDGINKKYLKISTKSVQLTSGKKILITSLTDITKSKMLEHELHKMSATDALTGISNRGGGEAQISKLIGLKKKGMFALLDVDKFKSINDNLGHGVGDKALIAVAKCLAKSFRGQDIVMRLGGDEFAVYAVGVGDNEIAKTCIGRLFDEIDNIDIEEFRDSGMKISISLGAAFWDGEKDITFEELYQTADAVMYESKKVSGNCYRIAGTPL